MVHFNISALIVLALGAASVIGAPFRVPGLQTRSNEVRGLVEHLSGAQELVSKRSPDSDAAEDIAVLYRRLDAEYKKKILDWLAQANFAAQFGQNTWANMHSGGTSLEPHCRPQGLKKTEKVDGPKKGNKTTKVDKVSYLVKMSCARNEKKPDTKTEEVSSFTLPGDGSTVPTTATVKAELTIKVNAL